MTNPSEPAHSPPAVPAPESGGVLTHDVATQRGTVRVLTLDRPSKRNALTPAMLSSLKEQARVLRSEPHIAAVLLTGRGPTFCAGFDLSLCQHDATALATLLAGLAQCISLLREQHAPVVISAHGAAVAGACALLGAADIVVTNTQAKIGYPVVKLGISPAVSAPTLCEQTTPGIARTRLLDTQLVDGNTALRLGLAHFVEESAEACQARALAIAHELAAKPAHALQATRRWCQQLAAANQEPARWDAEGQLLTRSPSEKALAASLSLVNGSEEKALLPIAWSR